MKPINMCTLEVRIGNCNLNLKSDGYVGLSLEMRNTHLLTQPKPYPQCPPSNESTPPPSNSTPLSEWTSKNPSSHHQPTLKYLSYHIHQCRILLHLIRENRDKKVIGIATVDITKENSQGFKYHQFGQCADCEADI